MNGLERIINIQNIRGYVDDKGTVWLNLEDVSRGLGFEKTEIKNGVRYASIRKKRVGNYLKNIGFDHIWSKMNNMNLDISTMNFANVFIPENVFYMLAMKANNQVAFNFQQRIANEILPMIRKTGMYMTDELNTFLMNNPNMINQIVRDYNAIKLQNDNLIQENKALNSYAREKDGQINELWDRLSEYEDIEDDDEDY